MLISVVLNFLPSYFLTDFKLLQYIGARYITVGVKSIDIYFILRMVQRSIILLDCIVLYNTTLY